MRTFFKVHVFLLNFAKAAQLFRLLTVLLLLCSGVDNTVGFSLGLGIRSGVKQWLKDTQFSEYADWLGCGFAKYPSPADRLDNLTTGLRSKVLCQEAAIAQIVKAFKSFEQRDPSEKSRKPLALHLTGPTGVGKTLTANLIAELAHDTGRVVLKLRGEDFTDESKKSQHQSAIKKSLQENLRKCNGQNVIIFDEVQRAADGVLDVFNSILEDGEFTIYKPDNSPVRIDCHNAKFIFISDFAMEAIYGPSVIYKNNEEDKHLARTTEMKNAMDEEKETKRYLIETITVPLEPLNTIQLAQILELHLKNLADWGVRKHKWRHLEFDANFYKHLISSCVQEEYAETEACEIEDPENPTCTPRTYEAKFAKEGARRVMKIIDKVKTELLDILDKYKIEKKNLAYLQVKFDDSKTGSKILAQQLHYRTIVKACHEESCNDEGENKWKDVPIDGSGFIDYCFA